MARNVGLIGSLRGKLGNAVFYVTNGVQVSRVYQPIVANPNTPMQIAQRAKMTLAGRMSKITPIVALAGLEGSNKRLRRGSFVKEIIKATTYADNTASLQFDNLILSHGNVQLQTNQSYSVATGNSYIRITVSVSRAVATVPVQAGYGLRAVAYFMDNTNSGNDMCATNLCTIPSGETAATTILQQNITRGTASNYTVVVYVFPFLAVESLDGVNYSFVGNEEETYIVIDGLRSVATLRYGESMRIAATQSRGDDGEDVEPVKRKK